MTEKRITTPERITSPEKLGDDNLEASLRPKRLADFVGQQQARPWGISESAYFAQDHSLAYQYSPFGVPRLALRRTPAADHVIAPYATMMATMFAPHEAVSNLRRLEKLQSRGEFGFMDAVDFTASHQPHAEPFRWWVFVSHAAVKRRLGGQHVPEHLLSTLGLLS